MADTTVVHIGENSPEQVAYKLLVNIAAIEGYYLREGPYPAGNKSPTKEWLLSTYSECLTAVQSPSFYRRD